MEAIVKISGKQYRVSEGNRIEVDRLSTPVGETVTFDEVLLLTGGARPEVGLPTVAGASVAAKVVAEKRGPKITVFKYKAKKRYRRTRGSRADLTLLEIVSVGGGSKKQKAAAPKEDAPAKSTDKAE